MGSETLGGHLHPMARGKVRLEKPAALDPGGPESRALGFGPALHVLGPPRQFSKRRGP